MQLYIDGIIIRSCVRVEHSKKFMLHVFFTSIYHHIGLGRNSVNEIKK